MICVCAHPRESHGIGGCMGLGVGGMLCDCKTYEARIEAISARPQQTARQVVPPKPKREIVPAPRVGERCPTCGTMREQQQPLTRRQRQVMSAIEGLFAQLERPPTLREVADACGLKSESTVHEHVGILREKGWLMKSPQKGAKFAIVPR